MLNGVAATINHRKRRPRPSTVSHFVGLFGRPRHWPDALARDFLTKIACLSLARWASVPPENSRPIAEHLEDVGIGRREVWNAAGREPLEVNGVTEQRGELIRMRNRGTSNGDEFRSARIRCNASRGNIVRRFRRYAASVDRRVRKDWIG